MVMGVLRWLVHAGHDRWTRGGIARITSQVALMVALAGCVAVLRSMFGGRRGTAHQGSVRWRVCFKGRTVLEWIVNAGHCWLICCGRKITDLLTKTN